MDIKARILFLKKSILINDEELLHWTPWHCHRFFCKNHMCKTRSKKITKLSSDYIRMTNELDMLEYKIKTDFKSY
jgi:hypothetical protein